MACSSTVIICLAWPFVRRQHKRDIARIEAGCFVLFQEGCCGELVNAKMHSKGVQQVNFLLYDLPIVKGFGGSFRSKLPLEGIFSDFLASFDNRRTRSGCIPRNSTTSLRSDCSSFVIFPSSHARANILRTNSSPYWHQLKRCLRVGHGETKAAS